MRCLTPLAMILLTGLAGCQILGVAAAVLPDQDIPAKYDGLANQKVAVMVWAERGIRIDYPPIQLDLAGGIQQKLEQAAAVKDPPKELIGTTFPVKPQSIVRYQQDHPEIESMDVKDVAPRLAARTGLTRLVYVEVSDFTTRSSTALDLFLGRMTATVKVYEISNGQAKIVYHEDDVKVKYSPKAGDDGVPNLDDYKVYLGTLGEFTTEVATRFFKHPSDD